MSKRPICKFENVPIWINHSISVNENGEKQDSVCVYLDPEKERDCFAAGFNVHSQSISEPAPYIIMKTCTEKFRKKMSSDAELLTCVPKTIPSDRIVVGSVTFTYIKFKFKDGISPRYDNSDEIMAIYLIDVDSDSKMDE